MAEHPPTEQPPSSQWEQRQKELVEQIVLLLERARGVFQKYKEPIFIVGIALAAMPFLVFIVALLTVINILPLLAPTFKLIGFGFTTWFVYRYLLFAPNRQELSQEFQNLKGQVLGPKDERSRNTAKFSNDHSTDSSNSNSE